MSTKRITVSINAETVEKLRQLQARLKQELGLDLSITQVIDYLVAQNERGKNE